MKSWLYPLFIICIFLFLRFYNIKESFFFFNDTGRDSSVLQNWLETGKPPLLGPQTSALPINQSAIYFYLLYPAFLLTNQSPYHSLYTSAFIYISLFIFCLHLSKNNPLLKKITLTAFFLFSIHPQFIIQNRSVWNPSLAPPFILLSIISFLLLSEKLTKKNLLFFSLSIATAISLTYSAAPLLIAFVILSLFYQKKHFVKIIFSVFASLVFTNLPTIFFELRHKFLLTQSLFSQGSQPQSGLDISSKINNLSNFCLSTPSNFLNIALATATLLISVWLIKINHRFKLIPKLLLLTTVITLLAPITVQSHYIFAILVLIFTTISLLPKLILLPILAVLSFFYLNQNQLKSYFSPAPRTYSQMESCFRQICSEFKKPVFSSVQSDLHPYHYGPEHRYLLKKTGCDLKSIETDPESANHMLVIEDSGTFTPNQTIYHELSLFGSYTLISEFNCQNNFKVKLIQKDNL